jgi:HAD superfamily hydrolase (TIGR01549 family)
LRTEDGKKEVFTKIKEEVFSVVEDFELEAARTAKIFEGIQKTLKTLRDMNLEIALCTISSEKTTNYVLKRFHLEDFFDAVVTRESVFEVKPHPSHLKATLDALKVSSQEAILVGDSIKDIECAIHLNVLAVGVTTGLSTIKELTCSGAHYIASSVNYLPILLEQLNKTVRKKK